MVRNDHAWDWNCSAELIQVLEKISGALKKKSSLENCAKPLDMHAEQTDTENYNWKLALEPSPAEMRLEMRLENGPHQGHGGPLVCICCCHKCRPLLLAIALFRCIRHWTGPSRVVLCSTTRWQKKRSICVAAFLFSRNSNALMYRWSFLCIRKVLYYLILTGKPQFQCSILIAMSDRYKT